MNGQTVAESLENRLGKEYQKTVVSSDTWQANLLLTVLSELDLASALARMAQHMRYHGLNVDVHIEGRPVNLPKGKVTLIYEATQELLFNVVKHAAVRHATVFLRHRPTHHLILTVADIGRGFIPPIFSPEQAIQATCGLFKIWKDSEAIGGHLIIDSAPGHGTRATLTV